MHGHYPRERFNHRRPPSRVAKKKTVGVRVCPFPLLGASAKFTRTSIAPPETTANYGEHGSSNLIPLSVLQPPPSLSPFLRQAPHQTVTTRGDGVAGEAQAQAHVLRRRGAGEHGVGRGDSAHEAHDTSREAEAEALEGRSKATAE